MVHRRWPAAATVALLSLLAGCVGTVGRVVNARPFGWPLFDAVRTDARVVAGTMLPKDRWFVPIAVLSLPLDLALDVVLLPVDCVAGLCGWRRD
jgi:hypothetical protein